MKKRVVAFFALRVLIASSSGFAVTQNEIGQIFTSLNVLRTNPHALDAQIPQMTGTTLQAIQEHFPEHSLLPYGEAQKRLLSGAAEQGIIQSGSQKGKSYASLLDARFKAIPRGPLLEATQSLLPISVFLAEKIGADGIKDLVDLSVQHDGTNSALYGALLLHSSSIIHNHLLERQRIREEEEENLLKLQTSDSRAGKSDELLYDLSLKLLSGEMLSQDLPEKTLEALSLWLSPETLSDLPPEEAEKLQALINVETLERAHRRDEEEGLKNPPRDTTDSAGRIDSRFLSFRA